MSLVLDTHAAVWYALGSDRLSATARQRIDAAVASDLVYFSAITLVEIIYLVEKERFRLQTVSGQHARAYSTPDERVACSK